ncbi:MAG: CBS domain-containing protein [Hyphomicrobiaceae bacterium]
MKCQDFMLTDPPRLEQSQTIEKAIKTLIDSKLSALPVVDGSGRLVGLFSARELFGRILPAAVKLGSLVPDLAFMDEPLKHTKGDLDRISRDPVGQHIEKNPQVAHPDTTMMEALLLLYRGRSVLPVVEKGTNRLVGVTWRLHALAKIMESNSDAR